VEVPRRTRLHRVSFSCQRRRPERPLLLRELDRPRGARRLSQPSRPKECRHDEFLSRKVELRYFTMRSAYDK
jgi:hypothetical protein